MGREKFLKQLSKIGSTFIGLGIFVGLISLFMTLIFITDGFSIPLLIFIVLFICSMYIFDKLKALTNYILKKTNNI